MLVLAGEQDIVTEYKYTVELFEKFTCPSKKMHSFPQGRHECQNDFESEEYIQIMLEWTKAKLATYNPTQQCNKE